MKKEFVYIGNCVVLPANFIISIMDNSKEITFNTFVRNVGLQELKNIFETYYFWGNKKGLHIKDDYAVSWYKSKIGNQKFFIVKHSAIEYIWKQIQGKL